MAQFNHVANLFSAGSSVQTLIQGRIICDNSVYIGYRRPKSYILMGISELSEFGEHSVTCAPTSLYDLTQSVSDP